MKQKCICCSTVKGKRGCLLKGMALICPPCCADIRNPACEGCSYYKDSQKFAAEKATKSPKHFTIRMDPEVDDQIDRALRMVEAGNIVGGESVIRSLMAENADLYTIHFAMGTIYGFKGQYDKAMACFDKSIAIYPYYVDSWFNRALSAQKKLDIIEMVFSLRKVIELGDSRDQAVVMAEGLLDEFEQVTRQETGLELEAYMTSMKKFNAAFGLMQDKQWKKAIVGYKESIRINPASPQAFGNMALCYAYLNENNKALEAFDKAIAIDPDYEPAMINKVIFQNAIAKGLSFSEAQSEAKVIEYVKDYPSEGGNRLIDDYFNDRIK
jgi:tetratricopeptide (TPR) repeat protein